MEKFNTFLLVVLMAALGVGGWLYVERKKQDIAQMTVLLEQSKASAKELAEKLQKLQQQMEQDAQQTAKAFQQNTTLVEEVAKQMALLQKQPDIPVDADPILSALMLSKLTDEQIRQYAVRILGKLPGDAAVERILQLAESDPDNGVKQACYDILQRKKPDELAQLLLKQLTQGSQPEKAIAAQGLAQVAKKGMGKDLLATLKEFQGNDYQTARVRRSIYQALRRIGDPSLCKPLVQCFFDETEEGYKYELANSIVRCMRPENIDLVSKTVFDSKDSELRKGYMRTIMEGLGKLEDLRTTPALMKYLVNDDYSGRKACEYILRNSDPLAAASVVKYYNATNNGNKQRVRQLITEKTFPGIIVNGEELTVVGEKEMNELLEKRAKQVKALEEADKRRGKQDIF